MSHIWAQTGVTELGLDSPEAAEAIVLMGRINDIFRKRHLNAWTAFKFACQTAPQKQAFVKLFLEEFVVQVHHDGLYNVFDMSFGSNPFQVFYARVAPGLRLHLAWKPDVVRGRLTDAIDRELVLEDLARLG